MVKAAYNHGHVQFATQHPCRCLLCEDALESNRMRRTRLDSAPLLRFLQFHYGYNPGGFGYNAMGGLHGLETDVQRAIHRARKLGWVTEWSADELSTRLGIHPGDLWPEWETV